MFRRATILCAALVTLTAFCAGYALAWSVIWRVPEVDRDGMEWLFVALMTLPWSLAVGVGGRMVVHAGAVINATLLSLLMGRTVKQRIDDPEPSGRPR
jgi:hypothetical protein